MSCRIFVYLYHIVITSRLSGPMQNPYITCAQKLVLLQCRNPKNAISYSKSLIPTPDPPRTTISPHYLTYVRLVRT